MHIGERRLQEASLVRSDIEAAGEPVLIVLFLGSVQLMIKHCNRCCPPLWGVGYGRRRMDPRRRQTGSPSR